MQRREITGCEGEHPFASSAKEQSSRARLVAAVEQLVKAVRLRTRSAALDAMTRSADARMAVRTGRAVGEPRHMRPAPRLFLATRRSSSLRSDLGRCFTRLPPPVPSASLTSLRPCCTR